MLCLPACKICCVQDLHYFSDSDHHSVGPGLMPRQELRRLRNRTLSGLDTLRLGEQARERSHSLSLAGGGLAQAPRTPCTPTFASQKDAITNFVDFNPADFVKYKIDRYSEAGDMRLSGSLHVHLLSGRGLKAAGKYKRFRDLYCVVEVDHVHKARTVVRSGGLNFDWDEKFQLDLLNNMEVEFLIYSWDPQLRHRLNIKMSPTLFFTTFFQGFVTGPLSDLATCSESPRDITRLPSDFTPPAWSI